MEKDKTKIMYDSPEAAEYRTNLSGWVSANGYYYGSDERAARYNGCTHQKCTKCGGDVEYNAYCEPCADTREQEKHDRAPSKKWDGKGMIYSASFQQYFSEIEEAEEFALENNCEIEELILYICEPISGRLIDEDFFCDELPEDGDLPSELQEAMEEFNDAVAAYGTLSWTPGEYRLEL